MGFDKASIPVDGTPIGLRTAQSLRDAGWTVVILGGEAISGFDHRPDRVAFRGPLAAIREAWNGESPVFLVSCDLPFFEASVAEAMLETLGSHEAVVPVIEGRRQPLCGLYSGAAMKRLSENPDWVRMSEWVNRLRVCELDGPRLESLGLSARMVRGVNTQAELAELKLQD